jgi:Mn-dependent DtxR family transcriptional regulator
VREAELEWTFLTNHAHVLLCIVREPEVRMRDVAQMVGVTERAVQRIVADLEQAGYLVRTRHGRRNLYEVRGHLPLRHPVERHERVSSLIAIVQGKPEADESQELRPYLARTAAQRSGTLP